MVCTDDFMFSYEFLHIHLMSSCDIYHVLGSIARFFCGHTRHTYIHIAYGREYFSITQNLFHGATKFQWD